MQNASHCVEKKVRHTYLAPQPQRSVRTCRHTPRLSGMPVETHDTQPALDFVSFEHFQGYNGCVLHQVSYNLSVENLDSAVVGGIGEER